MRENCPFKVTYMWASTLAIINIIIWVLLAATTCTFIVMLRRRFSAAEFSSPRHKLVGFLSVFSISFFVRGTWDILTQTSLNFDSQPTGLAVLIFFVYFVTEWVPIFVVYLYHFWAFYEHYKLKKLEKQDIRVSMLTPAESEN